MAYRPVSINIPEVETGQVVSASLQMNAYSRYLTALLGEGLGSYSAVRNGGSVGDNETTYTTVQTLYLVHSKNDMIYALAMKTTGGTGSCQIINADDATQYVELTTTETSYEFKSGTVADAFEANANGDIITLNVQVKVSNAAYTCSVRTFVLGQQGGTVTWSRPDFTNATASAAADFNAVRTVLRALENSRIGNLNPLLASDTITSLTPTDTWIDATDAVIRYRPEDLYVWLECEGGGGSGINWRVIFYNVTDWETAVDTYTKGYIGTPAAYTYSTAAIPWDGYGFTFGDWVRCRVQGYDDGGSTTARIRRAFVFRHSDMAPVAEWANPKMWVEGDTVVGNAEMDKVCDDIDELIDGGGEELWGMSLATTASPAAGVGDAEDRAFTGIHRRRWLCCKAHSSSETPAIQYGANLAYDIALAYDQDHDWQIYDLDEYPELVYGGPYIVTGADVAFESTLIPTVTT